MKAKQQASTPTLVLRSVRPSKLATPQSLNQILSHLRLASERLGSCIPLAECHDDRVAKCGYNGHETHTRVESGAIELWLTEDQDSTFTRASNLGWVLVGCWSAPVTYGPAKILLILGNRDQVVGLMPSGKMERAPAGSRSFVIPRQWWNAR
jgi:hypothetical protein